MATTQKELEGLVKRLNRITNNQSEPYTKQENGKFISNIGNYHLDYAYGGVKLVQVVSDGGGIRTITHGYNSKRECYDQIAMYIKGIEDCIMGEQELNQKIEAIVKG